MNKLKTSFVSISLLLILISGTISQAEERWKIWSGNLWETDPVAADSIDNHIINLFARWVALADTEIWIPIEYVWNESDSAVKIERFDMMEVKWPGRWWYEVVGGNIQDADYDLYAYQISHKSPLKIKPWKLKGQGSLSKAFRVPDKKAKHKEAVLKNFKEKKEKKLKKLKL